MSLEIVTISSLICLKESRNYH